MNQLGTLNDSKFLSCRCVFQILFVFRGAVCRAQSSQYAKIGFPKRPELQQLLSIFGLAPDAQLFKAERLAVAGSDQLAVKTGRDSVGSIGLRQRIIFAFGILLHRKRFFVRENNLPNPRTADVKHGPNLFVGFAFLMHGINGLAPGLAGEDGGWFCHRLHLFV